MCLDAVTFLYYVDEVYLVRFGSTKRDFGDFLLSVNNDLTGCARVFVRFWEVCLLKVVSHRATSISIGLKSF